MALTMTQKTEPRGGLRLRSLASITRQDLRSKKGYTMSEIIIIIVVLGLLAAVAVPIYNNIRDSGADNVKIKNADMLNSLMTAVHNGGVDVTAWATGADAITALQVGVNIPSSDPAAAAQQVKLQKAVNPAAYTFTPGNATTAPLFTAKLNEPNVRP